eukprot:13695824-Alexandrium_andersonii.AAC.1
MARGVVETVIGDIGYADDTMIAGEEEEMVSAEHILCETLEDWEERVNRDKTERLRVGGDRAAYDVRGSGESGTVRHAGGWLSEDSRQHVDTAK